MPIITRKVGQTAYLYFARFNKATGKRDETYCGRADSPEAQSKARSLESQYVAERVAYSRANADRVSVAQKARVIVEMLAQEIQKQAETRGFMLIRSQRIGQVTADYIIREESGAEHAIDVAVIAQLGGKGMRATLGKIASLAMFEQDLKSTLFVLVFTGIQTIEEIAGAMEAGRRNIRIEREGFLRVGTDNGTTIRVLLDSVRNLDDVSREHLALLSKRIVNEVYSKRKP